MDLVTSLKMKYRKFEGSVQMKTVRYLQKTRPKKWIIVVNFCAVLVVRDRLPHTSRATTFTSKFNAPLVSPNFCGNIVLKASPPSVENNFTNFEWRRLFDSSWCKEIKFFVEAFFWYNSVKCVQPEFWRR